MKIDYNKFDLTKEELKHINKESTHVLGQYPTHIPVFVQLDSNMLKMNKQKFLVSKDISFMEFVNKTLKKKLLNLSTNDVIIIHTIKYSEPTKLTEIKLEPKQIIDIYKEHHDPETQTLILRISRSTTFKTMKNLATYFLGY